MEIAVIATTARAQAKLPRRRYCLHLIQQLLGYAYTIQFSPPVCMPGVHAPDMQRVQPGFHRCSVPALYRSYERDCLQLRLDRWYRANQWSA